MKREVSALLNQLSASLGDIMEKMEKAIKEKNIKEFEKLRKLFFEIQEKIIEVSE